MGYYDFLRQGIPHAGAIDAPPLSTALIPYTNFNASLLENILDTLQHHSLILDIPLRDASLRHLCSALAEKAPQDSAVTLVTCGTDAPRSQDGQFVCDIAGNFWSLINDDTYIAAAFVPARKPHIITDFIYTGDLSQQHLDNFLHTESIRASLLVTCHPHSRDIASVGWNNFALMGRFVVQMQQLAHDLGDMTIGFIDDVDTTILEVAKRNGTLFASSAMGQLGFIGSVVEAINSKHININSSVRLDKKDTTLIALKCLYSRHGVSAYLVWRMLLAWKAAQETRADDEDVACTIIHSRIINDYMDYNFSEALIESVTNLCDHSLDFLSFLKSGTVRIGCHDIHKGSIGPRFEVPHDHERRGVLDCPRLSGRKRIGGLLVRGGRGQPVLEAKPKIGFSVRGHRYVLRVKGGKVLTRNNFSPSDMVKPFCNLKRIGSQFFGEVEWQERDPKFEGSGELPITNATANSIISGGYGTLPAMWLWTHVLCGDVVVTESSLNMTYLNMARRKCAEDGLHFQVPLDSGCLARVVTYCSSEEDGADDCIWLDIFDSGKLREVKKDIGVVIQIGEVDPSAVSKATHECSFAMHVVAK